MLSAKASDRSRTRELIDAMHRGDGFVLLPKKFLSELGPELAVTLAWLVDFDFVKCFDLQTGERNSHELFATDSILRASFRTAPGTVRGWFRELHQRGLIRVQFQPGRVVIEVLHDKIISTKLKVEEEFIF